MLLPPSPTLRQAARGEGNESACPRRMLLGCRGRVLTLFLLACLRCVGMAPGGKIDGATRPGSSYDCVTMGLHTM